MSETHRPLLDLVTVAREHGRPIPDAATGETIGFAPIHGVPDLDRAVQLARTAQPGWDSAGHAARRRALHAIADEVDRHADELAVLLSKEQGKPLDGPNARFEVSAAALWIRNTADTEIEPEVVFADGDARAELDYGALGVVGAIGPWNWPMMITVWQVAPALRMGNAVVVKPSEYTPLSVLALLELFSRHLPEGILSVVTGGREVGAALAAHPDVAKIMFTGSTATGRHIVEASANNLARLTLELGGNDAGIVLPDADVAAIADDLFWGIFINTGQTCASLKRLYVHESLYDEVVQALADRASSTPMGRGLEPGVLLGPLQNRAQFDVVSRLVEEARTRGARIVTGGCPAPELGAHFYQPTVVADIDDDAALVQEEQFGPVIPVLRYETLDDAVDRANATEQGLGASVWGSDRAAALAVAQRLRAGTVWINRHGALNPHIPFGGSKASGYGLEFGAHGLKAVASPKVVSY